MLHFLHERILGKKNSDTGKTKTRRQRSRLHSRQVLEQVRVPLVPQPYSHAPRQAQASLRKAQQGLLQKPLSHAEQQFRRTGRPFILPCPRGSPALNGSRGGGGELGECSEPGQGVRPPPLLLCFYRMGCPHRAQPPRAAGTDARETRGPKPQRPHAGYCSRLYVCD